MKNFIKKLSIQIGNKFVDLIAIIVACIAIIISINQGISQKEFERINKQPLLNIEFIKVDDATKKGIRLSNLGFGPAIIKSFKYYLNEKDVGNASKTYYKWLPRIEDSLEFKFEDINYLAEGNIIGEKDSNEDIFLLGTSARIYLSKENPGTFYNSKTARFIAGIVIEIEYQSINPIDQYTYYLRFGDGLEPSNYRENRK